MQLEQQVTSLELSKRLKELGFEQSGTFIWMEYNNGNEIEYRPGPISPPATCVAFTASELGKLLPRFTFMNAGIRECSECGQDIKPSKEKECVYLAITANTGGGYWTVDYHSIERTAGHRENGDTLVDAIAKMLIYLKEQELI